eukprot:15326792-Ditylum_brightwellii.AAC.1
MYAVIKCYLKGEQNSGLSYIEIPDMDQYWWLYAMGMRRCFQQWPTSWILSTLLTLVTTATYHITYFLYPHVPLKRVAIKEEMDAHLLDHHRRHFHQAYGTPFTVHPIRTMITKLGPQGFQRQLKNKIINVKELKISEFTKDMLHWITPSPNDPPILAYNLEITQVKYG